MNMYDSLFSSSCALNEQIARQIFDILPEQGPVMIIMDREGNSWPSDSEKFSSLNISESFLKEVCNKIDDGDETIVTLISDRSVVGVLPRVIVPQTHVDVERVTGRARRIVVEVDMWLTENATGDRDCLVVHPVTGPVDV